MNVLDLIIVVLVLALAAELCYPAFDRWLSRRERGGR
jgi:Tfp pilus assembly protein PilE